VSRRRIVLIVGATTAACLLIAAQGADAKGILGTGIGPDIGPSLNPFPSVSELLSGVVKGLFGALLKALTPDFLKHADIHTLEWLVALPNVADSGTWPTIDHLQGDMVWIAGAILPTTLIIATARDTALSLSFRAHPGNALLRVVGAVFWLVLYRFSVENGLAFVNILTHTILSLPVVAQGLHRTVLVLFGGSVLAGVGGAFLGLLGLVALFFAVSLFALKVLLLMVLAVLYVAGPLLIAFTPLPVVGFLNRAWLLALVGLCLIPVGWCVIFATAGAISLDVTNLGSGAHLGSRTVGAFAALATFYVAFRWPFLVLGHVRASVGGVGVRLGGGSGGGAASLNDGALAAKAQRARAGLRAAMLTGGRGVGLAAGALGAPSGGLVGAAKRRARPHVASTAATGAIALGPPRPRAPGANDRLTRAADVLRATPGRMREAWRTATASPAQLASTKPNASARRKPAGGSATGTRGQSRAAGGSRRTGSPKRSTRARADAPRPSSPAEARQRASGTTRVPRSATRPVAPADRSSQPSPSRPPRGAAPGGESPAHKQASAPARPRQGKAAPGASPAPSPRPAPRKGVPKRGQSPRPARPASSPATPPRAPRKGKRK
jgi:hypothetical protein